MFYSIAIGIDTFTGVGLNSTMRTRLRIVDRLDPSDGD